MPEPQHDTAASVAKTVRAVVPRPIKRALRPFAAALLEAPVEVPAGHLAALDRPVGDRYTVHVRGRTHRFFFLCGCWRSGTHWVSRVLNLHPQINIVGEFHFDHFLDGFRRWTGQGWYLGRRPNLQRIASQTLETSVRRCVYAATRNKPEALWLGDHSPRRLETLLPGAPNFLVLRDGRDVITSQYWHSLRAKRPTFFIQQFRPLAKKYCAAFRESPEAFKGPDAGFFAEDFWVRFQARYWAKFMEACLDEKERLEASGTRVHVVSYEQLHRDYEPQRQAMYRFLGLDPAQAALPSHETKTLPGFQTETLTSDNRKGVVGDWRNYFSDRVKRIYKEEAGETLIRLGYEKNLNW